MNNFVDFSNYSIDTLFSIQDIAAKIKATPNNYTSLLQHKKLYMLFQKTSTRTALSFAQGMYELGGFHFMQNWDDSNFKLGDIQDEIRYVGRNCDIVMARLKHNSDINLMSEYSSVPVINGCCNKYHPCQAMADLMTIKEILGGYNVKLLYIGVKNNVLNSLIESLPGMGGDVYSLTPLVNEPSVDQDLYNRASASGHYHELPVNISVEELNHIISGMDVVYTDTWIDMEFFTDKAYEKEKNERIEKMMPYQLNQELLAGSKALVLHDMPMHAGYEISRETIELNIDNILHQAENRRHAQKGIIAYLLGAEV